MLRLIVNASWELKKYVWIERSCRWLIRSSEIVLRWMCVNHAALHLTARLTQSICCRCEMKCTVNKMRRAAVNMRADGVPRLDSSHGVAWLLTDSCFLSSSLSSTMEKTQNRSIPVEKEHWPSAGAQREVLACFQEAVRGCSYTLCQMEPNIREEYN